MSGFVGGRHGDAGEDDVGTASVIAFALVVTASLVTVAGVPSLDARRRPAELFPDDRP